jgi:hypothetical protein
MFQVQVRPEIFPEGFFAQRRIVEFGIQREATENERKKFEEWEREVRNFIMTFAPKIKSGFSYSTQFIQTIFNTRTARNVQMLLIPCQSQTCKIADKK